jgi:hypothetical protein
MPDDYAFTAEDDALLCDVRSLVWKKPKVFVEAGAWLDEMYGPKTVRLRMREPKEVQAGPTDKSDPIWADRPINLSARDLPGSEEWVSPARRFWLVLHDLDREVQDLPATLKWTTAARVLIVCWLLTDPDAGLHQKRLTAFQGWPWEGEHGLGRRIAEDEVVSWPRLLAAVRRGIVVADEQAPKKSVARHSPGPPVRFDPAGSHKLVQQWKASGMTKKNFENKRDLKPRSVVKAQDRIRAAREREGR